MSFLRTHPYLKGILLALGGFTLFACGDAIVKQLSQTYSTYTIVFFNLLLTATVLTVLSPKLGGLRPAFKSANRKWHLLRGIILALQLGTIIYGFAHMSMSKTYALIFTSPFYTTILALFFLQEAVAPRKWAAIALGFTGVLVILRPGMIPLDMPALAVLFSAVCFSFSNLIARRFGKGEPLLALGLLPQVSAVLCILPFYLMNFELPAGVDFPWFVAMSMLGAAGYLCISLCFVFAPAAVAAPFHYVQIIWGVLFGYIFFGDMLDPWVGLGAVIIIIAGLWLIWLSRERDIQTLPAQKDLVRP